jgi:hypothetical protein
VQDIPPMLPFTRIANQVNNSTDPIVTRTEADIIRTNDNKNTQRAQETVNDINLFFISILHIHIEYQYYTKYSIENSIEFHNQS